MNTKIKLRYTLGYIFLFIFSIISFLLIKQNIFPHAFFLSIQAFLISRVFWQGNLLKISNIENRKIQQVSFAWIVFGLFLLTISFAFWLWSEQCYYSDASYKYIYLILYATLFFLGSLNFYLTQKCKDGINKFVDSLKMVALPIVIILVVFKFLYFLDTKGILQISLILNHFCS